MAVSVVGLAAKAARAVFRVMGFEYSQLGWSANAIIAQFKAWGGEIRRTDALQIIRSVTGQMKYQKQVMAAPAEGPLNRKWITETDAALRGNYQIFASAVYTDKQTGVETPVKISFFSDENLGKEGWANRFIDGFGKFDYAPFYDVSSLTVTSAIHQTGKPY